MAPSPPTWSPPTPVLPRPLPATGGRGVTPDRFLRDQLTQVPDLVLEAVDGMSRRLKSPPLSRVEIVQLFADGANAPKFGTELRALLDG